MVSNILGELGLELSSKMVRPASMGNAHRVLSAVRASVAAWCQRRNSAGSMARRCLSMVCCVL